ncbi:hypothetical protein GCM10007921_09720 [Tritonibacter mobilis]|nr:hypothetical protein GCM10007921_09720 [Tritonibacter mobilis]
MTDRRLRHAKFYGGAGKAALTCGHLKGAQGIQGNVGTIWHELSLYAGQYVVVFLLRAAADISASKTEMDQT